MNLLNSNNWAGFFIVLAIALVVNLRAVSEYLDTRANRRQKFIEDALKLEKLSDTSKQFLEEELNYYVFKRVTGISADAVLREKLRDVIHRSGGDLQIRQLARVSQFLRMRDGKLTIAVSQGEIAWSWLNQFLAACVALVALSLFMAPGLVKGLAFTQVILSVAFGVFCFAFSMFLVLEAQPGLIAKRISPTLKQLESPPVNDVS